MPDRKEFPMMKKNPKSKEPALYVPVSPKDSIGQELYRYASLCRKLIIALFVIVGIIVGIFVGIFVGGEGGPIACIFLGIIGWLLGSLVADNATIFIDAKAELLINTARFRWIWTTCARSRSKNWLRSRRLTSRYRACRNES